MLLKLPERHSQPHLLLSLLTPSTYDASRTIQQHLREFLLQPTRKTADSCLPAVRHCVMDAPRRQARCCRTLGVHCLLYDGMPSVSSIWPGFEPAVNK